MLKTVTLFKALFLGFTGVPNQNTRLLTLKNIVTRKLFVAGLCLLFALPYNAGAQLCAGSLGDPVVNQRFDGPVPAGSTIYKQGFDCPEPGEYFLTNFKFGCGDKTWQIVAGDHTRLITSTTTSNLMLINASSTFGTVFKQTVSGLCANITYQFSAFVANEMKDNACGGRPVLPNLTFTATSDRGDLLGTYNTDDIRVEGAINWRQFGFFFTMPPGVSSITLEITSQGLNGCGGVFAIDDITLKPCGTKVGVTLDGDTLFAKDVCQGYTNPFILKASYLGFNNPKTIWQNSIDKGLTWNDIEGANTDTYQVPKIDSGIVLYRIIVAEAANFNSPKCRVASNPVWIGVHTAPPHQAPISGSACFNKNFALPAIPGTLHYLWEGPGGYRSEDINAVVPSIQYSDTGYYTAKVITDFGCYTVDSVYVTVSPSATVTVTRKFDICAGQSVQMDASGGGSYKWTPAAGLSAYNIPNPTARPTDSAEYQVLITNEYGCKDSATVAINIYRKTVIDAGPDKYMLMGDTASLTASIKGTGLSYYWTPDMYLSDSRVLNPKINPPEDITYTLHVTSSAGCGSGIDEVKVFLYNGLYIPNAFTPNGDGVNDVFRVIPLENFKLTRLSIYNRWGKIVFNTSTPGAAWDGRYNGAPQPTGTYIYYVEMKPAKGNTITRKGSILLIR